MFPRKPLHPTDLGLILSYKCQAACAHCLYNCGPGWQEWMTTDEIQAALDATLAWDHHYQVHITGGEPFLNFSLLLHAVEVAKELDIPCYVETNAGWCVRESMVEERFSALKNAGLQAVLISCSPFHAEAIPLEKTFLAIRKGEEIFGSRGVIVYLSEWIYSGAKAREGCFGRGMGSFLVVARLTGSVISPQNINQKFSWGKTVARRSFTPTIPTSTFMATTSPGSVGD